jgi:hypothetical protein
MDCECTDHIECDPPWPVCAQRRCVRCLDDTHLGCSGDTPLCKAGITIDANVCVECLSSADCGGDTPACQGNQCVPCSISDDRGCGGETPLCLGGDTPAENRCVQCMDGGDCGGDTPVCEDHVCIPCSTSDDSGCSEAELPRCFEGAVPEENSCVACLSADDCSDDRPLCLDNACLECDGNAQCLTEGASMCDETGTCVGCTSDDACSHLGGVDHCDASAGRCEQCLENAHCTDAASAKCLGNNTCGACETNEDCAHIDGKGVCGDAGVCVECTATDYSACEGGTMVCDTRPGPTQFTCSEEEPGSSGSCQECVSDAQCNTGRRCVMTEFNGEQTGYFCLWKEGAAGAPASCPSQGAPYVSRTLEMDSLDGDLGVYCKLRFTTCQGFAEFESQGCATDDDCGAPGLDDGYCRPLDEFEDRCTYRCLSADDCDGAACDTGVTPRVCSFDAL